MIRMLAFVPYPVGCAPGQRHWAPLLRQGRPRDSLTVPFGTWHGRAGAGSFRAPRRLVAGTCSRHGQHPDPQVGAASYETVSALIRHIERYLAELNMHPTLTKEQAPLIKKALRRNR